jgi:hypothetical protein
MRSRPLNSSCRFQSSTVNEGFRSEQGRRKSASNNVSSPFRLGSLLTPLGFPNSIGLPSESLVQDRAVRLKGRRFADPQLEHGRRLTSGFQVALA